MDWRCEHCGKKQGEYEGRGTVISHRCKGCGKQTVLDTR